MQFAEYLFPNYRCLAKPRKAGYRRRDSGCRKPVIAALRSISAPRYGSYANEDNCLIELIHRTMTDDLVLDSELQLLQPDFFNLLLSREIRALHQPFQFLGVAPMFLLQLPQCFFVLRSGEFYLHATPLSIETYEGTTSVIGFSIRFLRKSGNSGASVI